MGQEKAGSSQGRRWDITWQGAIKIRRGAVRGGSGTRYGEEQSGEGGHGEEQGWHSNCVCSQQQCSQQQQHPSIRALPNLPAMADYDDKMSVQLSEDYPNLYLSHSRNFTLTCL